MKDLLPKPTNLVRKSAIHDLHAGAARAIGGGNPLPGVMSEQPLR